MSRLLVLLLIGIAFLPALAALMFDALVMSSQTGAWHHGTLDRASIIWFALGFGFCIWQTLAIAWSWRAFANYKNARAALWAFGQLVQPAIIVAAERVGWLNLNS